VTAEGHCQDLVALNSWISRFLCVLFKTSQHTIILTPQSRIPVKRTEIIRHYVLGKMGLDRKSDEKIPKQILKYIPHGRRGQGRLVKVEWVCEVGTDLSACTVKWRRRRRKRRSQWLTKYLTLSDQKMTRKKTSWRTCRLATNCLTSSSQYIVRVLQFFVIF
jgi:hypothetical protein